ncbi:zinc finger CCHC domain-containing protein 13 [Trichonephila clavata]|uniref:Zinc finger CCHC domain-containing protein 13 n=1 Tax=Trichonephila clavata TaxID=2740835 RepID=A0A8X6FRU1_TRICU|nr:zinc finger CCHC domain-containing protein 13 [Trichonephila clavata]
MSQLPPYICLVMQVGKPLKRAFFLRIECDNKVKIKLVQAKSRVAPLKKDPITKTKNEMSIPKLELLAAVIGTRLVQSVKTSLNIHSIQTFYWTDSKVVLCWIKNSGTWKTFVRNRIKEIHSSSSKEVWYYVPSQMNAADIASRGCNAQTLFSLCWWEGPIWLKTVPPGQTPKTLISRMLLNLLPKRENLQLRRICL